MIQDGEILNTSVGTFKRSKSVPLPSNLGLDRAKNFLSCQALYSPENSDLEPLSLLDQAVSRYIRENHAIADNDQGIPLVLNYEKLDIDNSVANVHSAILAGVATPEIDP